MVELVVWLERLNVPIQRIGIEWPSPAARPIRRPVNAVLAPGNDRCANPAGGLFVGCAESVALVDRVEEWPVRAALALALPSAVACSGVIKPGLPKRRSSRYGRGGRGPGRATRLDMRPLRIHGHARRRPGDGVYQARSPVFLPAVSAAQRAEGTRETAEELGRDELWIFIVLSAMLLFFAYDTGDDSFARDEGWSYVTWLGIG
ncbi:MAG: hypothetical protein LC799_27400 [Actinobacteria bacterium]|nr:hypothetical protein [Actinomycetota bacterium]